MMRALLYTLTINLLFLLVDGAKVTKPEITVSRDNAELLSSFAVLDSPGHLAYIAAKRYAMTQAPKSWNDASHGQARSKCEEARMSAFDACKARYCECNSCEETAFAVFLETPDFAQGASKEGCRATKIHAQCKHAVSSAFSRCRSLFLATAPPSHEKLMQVRNTVSFMELAGLHSSDGHSHVFTQVAPTEVQESKEDVDVMKEEARTKIFDAESSSGRTMHFNMEEVKDAMKDKDATKAKAAAKVYAVIKDASFKCKDLKEETYKQCNIGLCKYHGKCGTDLEKDQCEFQARAYAQYEKTEKANLKQERLSKEAFQKSHTAAALAKKETAQKELKVKAVERKKKWDAGAKSREASQKTFDHMVEEAKNKVKRNAELKKKSDARAQSTRDFEKEQGVKATNEKASKEYQKQQDEGVMNEEAEKGSNTTPMGRRLLQEPVAAGETIEGNAIDDTGGTLQRDPNDLDVSDGVDDAHSMNAGAEVAKSKAEAAANAAKEARQKALTNSTMCKTSAKNSFNACQQLTTQSYHTCSRLFEAANQAFDTWKNPPAPPSPAAAPAPAPGPATAAAPAPPAAKEVDARLSTGEALQTASIDAAQHNFAAATKEAAEAVAASNKVTAANAAAAAEKLQSEANVLEEGTSLYEQQEALFEEEVTPSLYDQQAAEFTKETDARLDIPPQVESLYEQQVDEYNNQLNFV